MKNEADAASASDFGYGSFARYLSHVVTPVVNINKAISHDLLVFTYLGFFRGGLYFWPFCGAFGEF